MDMDERCSADEAVSRQRWQGGCRSCCVRQQRGGGSGSMAGKTKGRNSKCAPTIFVLFLLTSSLFARHAPLRTIPSLSVPRPRCVPICWSRQAADGGAAIEDCAGGIGKASQG